MVDKHDPFMRELEEEFRREQLKKLWDNYGTYFIAAAAAIVIVIGGYKFVEARRMAADEAQGAMFETARRLVADNKSDDAMKALGDIAANAPDGYAALSRLQLAGLQAKAGKTAEALAEYEAVAGNRSTDPLLKGFAQLQVAAIRLADADFTEMQNRLTDLMSDQSPWSYSARELYALAAYKAGRAEDARKVLAELIADQKTPPSIIERATMVMGKITAAELAKTATASDGKTAVEQPAQTTKE